MSFLLYCELLLRLYIFMASIFWIKMACDGEMNAWDLETHLQPNDVGRNGKYDLLGDDNIRCARNCTSHPESRTCYYKFVVEQYYTLGAGCGNCSLGNKQDCYKVQCIPGNGIKKTVLAINRMFMGPAIQVCFGDEIVVDVSNHLPGRSTSIHWHGMHQQETPWMDGVPYITQCPILDGTTFRYQFNADTSGTMFYHSHTTFQKLDGLSGALIVRMQDSKELNRHLYDYDLYSHVIHLAEWYNVLADDKYPDGTTATEPYRIESYLINGHGVYLDENYNKVTNTPVAEYTVEEGRRYRFRVMAAISTTCAVALYFHNHTMTLIAVDGHPVEPEEIRSIHVRTGDRFDVVVAANQKPGYYPVIVQGADPGCRTAKQYGLLRYKEQEHGDMDGLVENLETMFEAIPVPMLNEDVLKCAKDPNSVCLTDICSIEDVPEKILQAEPTKRFFLDLGEHVFSLDELYHSGTYNKHYVIFRANVNVPSSYYIIAETINNISNKKPPTPLYMVEPPSDMVCAGTNHSGYRQCLHLIKVDKGDIVEIVLTEPGNKDPSHNGSGISHPTHLHGDHFWVINQGKSKEMSVMQEVQFYNNSLIDNKSNAKCKGRPLKRDMVFVPSKGFAVIRFEANNIGVWTLHCHDSLHNINGMSVIIQIGERSEFKPAPSDMPTCGDYLPPVHGRLKNDRP